ncbi:LuxR family transcriptional regulator, maltose regulon positive regulatory protein [Streptacidiphilus jiangxiensis]|uniref:LuxR family transcriptional regulator, maltose regulon positive regulatory protein n=1 Tax=Streptacidiphilus jiangxiensis TaxID=235985 RepID=A0A1H7P4X3_STRJI|nr:LuxR family transcriptional regulator, maltose regulon positive regulatory protein [Streptacidiphilus jiangxiensis]
MRLVDREGLVAALDRAAAGAVTVVTAPAGSGKTSLLRAWADRRADAHLVASVQVQRDQQDAQSFWTALLAAVCRLNGEPLAGELPTASPDFDADPAVDRILAELAVLPGRVSLVIDDVHELTSPEAYAALTRLLTSLPAHVHAVLATRRDLPLRLHRLRLAGELTELRAAELRFAEEETRALLTASGITLTPASVARLHERCEGWAAGLRLAVLSLTGHPDPERFVADFSGSNRTVAEYLVAEMLDRQPQEVQDLLLRTSVLERVNGELAGLLTARPGAERILLALEDANAFVISLDPQRTWFRYHHLLADLLRLELRRTRPDEVPHLHRSASAWLAEQGQTVPAVRHLQSAGDWHDAATLLADHSLGLMLDGQEEIMQTLLDAFPERAAPGFPELSVVRAMVDLVHGRLDGAAAHLAVTEACASSAPEPSRRRLRTAVAALQLSLARRRGDLADVRRHAEFLDARPAAETDEDLALGSDLRVMALMNLGTVEAWTDRHADGVRHLQEGADLARRTGRPYLEVACLAQLGFASKLPDFQVARTRCERAVALAEEHGWGTAPVLAPALVTLACSMVWSGEFDTAEELLLRADLALQSDSGPGIGTLLHLVKGMLHAGRGRRPEAEREFAEAHALQSQLSHPHALSGYVTGWLAATRARLGSLAPARETLAAFQAAPTGCGEIRNARAVLSLAEGDPAAALAQVAGVMDGSAPSVHVATLVEAQLLAALAHRDLAEHQQAEQAVERALALAEPQRLVLPFVMADAGKLVEAAPRGRSAHAALRADVLDVLHGVAPAVSVPPSAGGGQLSPTELRVLRYLPTNLSRPEIAGELSVSVNTVNTHVRNIYAKLQATDRTSAVQRARALRLLADRALPRR